MKYIDKYNKFIKLNESSDIKVDINEYNINIIKNGLIDLEDLGWKIYGIEKYDDSYDSICIKLEIDSTKITKYTRFIYKFDNNKFNSELNEILLDRKYVEYIPTDYEREIINTTKDVSQVLLDMLEYNNGAFYVVHQTENHFHNTIFLYKK